MNHTTLRHPAAFAEAEARAAQERALLATVPPPPPAVLIGLTSPAMGAGKSVVAQRLVDRHRFVPLKFAGPLKAMIRTLLATFVGPFADDIDRMIEGDLKETVIPEIGVTPRRLMQTLGTEWGRDCIRPDLWVHLLRLQIEPLLRRGRSVVIDDMRFFNEYETVCALGGIPVRVTRPGIADATGHPSEGGLSDVPMDTLPNTGTVADLQHLADRFVEIARSRVAATQV